MKRNAFQTQECYDFICFVQTVSFRILPYYSTEDAIRAVRPRWSYFTIDMILDEKRSHIFDLVA